jgi:predicted O-methyltransferase YrrM
VILWAAVAKRAASVVVAIPSFRFRRALVAGVYDRSPADAWEALGYTITRHLALENVVVDLPPDGPLRFEHLAGLFGTNTLARGVIALTPREGAYLFALARQMQARKVVEIGRFRGGSTIILAAAIGPAGQFWSIDLARKEQHFESGADYDAQTRRFLDRYGLAASLIVGHSLSVDLDTGDVDLVFIDGDHSYAGAKGDFDKWGSRVRIGGAVVLDDAFAWGGVRSHEDTVGRVVEEAIGSGQWRLIRQVVHLAHLERI